MTDINTKSDAESEEDKAERTVYLNKLVAIEASWLSDQFQDLKPDEKIDILREIYKKHKKATTSLYHV